MIERETKAGPIAAMVMVSALLVAGCGGTSPSPRPRHAHGLARDYTKAVFLTCGRLGCDDRADTFAVVRRILSGYECEPDYGIEYREHGRIRTPQTGYICLPGSTAKEKHD